MMHDPLSIALSNIQNAERVGRDICIVRPVSKVVKNVLGIMKKANYLGDTEILSDSRGGVIKVNLLGRINKTGVIKPRFPVKGKEFEKYEKRFLPAKDFGIIIVSTSKGMMPHYEAKEKDLGGRLISYCY